MSEPNATICKLCHKMLAHDEASNHHCDTWCGDEEDNQKLPGRDLNE